MPKAEPCYVYIMFFVQQKENQLPCFAHDQVANLKIGHEDHEHEGQATKR